MSGPHALRLLACLAPWRKAAAAIAKIKRHGCLHLCCWRNLWRAAAYALARVNGALTGKNDRAMKAGMARTQNQ